MAPDPRQVFSPAQIAALTQLIGQLAAADAAAVDPRGVIGATVQTYNPTTRRATVKVDGSSGPVDAFNWLNNLYTPRPGDRVFTWFEPPAGLLLVGVIRAATPLLFGCQYSDPAFSLPDSALTPLAGLTLDVDADPPIYVAGVCTVPVGQGGLWSASVAAGNAGAAIDRTMCEILVDGHSYRGEPKLGGSGDPIMSAATGAVWMFDGATATFNAFQDSGAPVDFDVRIQFWQLVRGNPF